ncbi:MAG: type II toxin-antitoxin system VapC family toxin [Acidobacteriota bacterium]
MEDLGRGPIGLDTAVFIYYIEEHPRFLDIVAPIFLAMDEGRFQAVTSALTLLETLVVPYRAANLGLADRYEILLTQSRGLRLIELDRPLLRFAAQLRATFRVKTPDALQLSAAMTAGCKVFLTHDRDLPSLRGIEVLQIGRYLEKA